MLYPEPGKFASSKLGVEITFRGDKKLYMRWVYRSLIRFGINER
jgi:hypothetical protein